MKNKAGILGFALSASLVMGASTIAMLAEENAATVQEDVTLEANDPIFEEAVTKTKVEPVPEYQVSDAETVNVTDQEELDDALRYPEADNIAVTNDITVENNSLYVKNEEFTVIDLGGNTVTFDSNLGLYVWTDALLKNGTLNFAGDNGLIVGENALLYLEGVTINGKATNNGADASTSAAVKVIDTASLFADSGTTITGYRGILIDGNGSRVHLEGTTVFGNNQYTAHSNILDRGDKDDKDATGNKIELIGVKFSGTQFGIGGMHNNSTILIKNSDLKGHYYGLTANGSYNNILVYVTDSSSVSSTSDDGSGIYMSGSIGANTSNTLFVDGASTISGPSGIEGKNAKIYVKESSVIATATPPQVTPNSNGSTSTGYAIVLSNNASSEKTSVSGNIYVDDSLLVGAVGYAEGLTEQGSESDIKVNGQLTKDKDDPLKLHSVVEETTVAVKLRGDHPVTLEPETVSGNENLYDAVVRALAKDGRYKLSEPEKRGESYAFNYIVEESEEGTWTVTLTPEKNYIPCDVYFESTDGDVVGKCGTAIWAGDHLVLVANVEDEVPTGYVVVEKDPTVLAVNKNGKIYIATVKVDKEFVDCKLVFTYNGEELGTYKGNVSIRKGDLLVSPETIRKALAEFDPGYEYLLKEGQTAKETKAKAQSASYEAKIPVTMKQVKVVFQILGWDFEFQKGQEFLLPYYGAVVKVADLDIPEGYVLVDEDGNPVTYDRLEFDAGKVGIPFLRVKKVEEEPVDEEEEPEVETAAGETVVTVTNEDIKVADEEDTAVADGTFAWAGLAAVVGLLRKRKNHK